MRIKDLRVHSIAVADPPLRSSYGLHAPYALRNIVELESEDGIVGIAETYGGEGPAAALRDVRDRVVGADAYRVTGDLLDLAEGEGGGAERSHVMRTPGENPLDAGPRTHSAIETACLDLIGRCVGVPVCDLLGGRVRNAVPFSAYAFYKHAGGGGGAADAREDRYGECLTPESIVRQVRSMIEEYGFRDIKLKGGVLDPDEEIETVRQLRDRFGPAVPLRIDPNSAWTVETSVAVGVALREELEDRYGPLPEEVERLLDYMRVRRLAERILVESMERDRQGIAITFHPRTPISPHKLVETVSSVPGLSVSPGGQLRLRSAGVSHGEVLASVRALLGELAS